MVVLYVSLGAIQGKSHSCPDEYQVSLGPKVPLLPGLDQHSTHPGQATPLAARGGSLAGYLSRQTSSQWGHFPNPLGQVAVVNYALATCSRHLIWAALLGLLEHCPGQQMNDCVSVPTQQHEAVLGISKAA